MAVDVCGPSPWLLLVNGVGVGRPPWGPLRRTLGAHIRTIPYDAPGCGDSDPAPGPLPVCDHAWIAAGVARAVGAQEVDVLGTRPRPTAPDAAGPAMTRLIQEMHRRILGNGYCTRPPALDCVFESVCETCTFFQTSIDFRPTLQAQHDHAAAHDEDGRRHLFADLLNRLDQEPAS